MAAPKCQFHAMSDPATALSSKQPPAPLPILHPCLHNSPTPSSLPSIPRCPQSLGDKGRLRHKVPHSGCGSASHVPTFALSLLQ